MSLSDMAFPEEPDIDKYDTPVEGLHRHFNGAGLLKRTLPRMKIERQGNCYSLVLGLQELGVINPGQLLWSGSEHLRQNQFTKAFLKASLRKDKLIEVDNPDDIRPHQVLIASVLRRPKANGLKGDYHFFSRLEGKTWIQKEGKTKLPFPLNINSTEPQNFLDNSYDEFVGFHTLPDTLVYHPRC